MVWFLYDNGLRHERVKLIQNYLKGLYERTKANNGYSSRSEIIEEVP